MLEAYDDPERLPRARQLQRRGPDAVEACQRQALLLYGDDDRVTRTLTFFLHEAAAGAAARPIGPGAPVDEGHSAGPAVPVAGGAVSTYENARDLINGPGWF